ncbi:hybrid sensor histidine kinase/response regulator [Aureicoccus marinus]|uniref:histidine kinase n=1 Tax=Aureicoccus marinus TaxID=754435 RepID=A0A2S7T7J5_9FLAO|nr:hybrid sensor histidine kinase/response regulator [Aureicoccus marinus]PQJ15903.1 hypothetical protein BST99_09350 [Aureicoccus marinus]
MSNSPKETPYILAIDDEQLNLELIRFILERHGFKYSGTSDDEKVFVMLEERLPDLILLDIVMPRVDGYKLCQKIKSYDRYRDIPVIFLTGKVQVKDKVKGFEVGGVDYVTKPFNEQELLARIKTHIELVNARKQIELQAENLQRSNQLKDRMFSIIGHDLRSPLSAAKLKMDFLMRGIIDPKAPEFLDDTVFGLLKTMDEALNLLQNLLGWAKSESGQMKVITEPLQLKDIADQTIRLLKMASDHKKIEITNEVPEDLYVEADMNMIKTVLRNLVSNAIKFTPADGKIRIRSVQQADRVHVQIIDTGPGISKADIKKILDTEEHFSKLGTDKEPGTGLGVALCQAFIAQHEGQMRIDSVPGKGSSFSFDLAKSKREQVLRP